MTDRSNPNREYLTNTLPTPEELRKVPSGVILATYADDVRMSNVTRIPAQMQFHHERYQILHKELERRLKVFDESGEA